VAPPDYEQLTVGQIYTTARDRDRQRRWMARATIGDHLPLVAATLVSALAIGLCYAGRLAAFDRRERERAGEVTVNLADATRVDQLEPVTALAFDHAGDRRFAARELLNALSTPAGRETLPNVGALAAITVPVRAIDTTRGLDAYAAKLRDARARAAAGERPEPASIPLFTASELAAVKPALVVRSRETHRRTVFWCLVAFLAGFQIVSLVWQLRGVPGDRVLLAAAHLLTTLGFVVMLSRPDPLRDMLAIVRYTQGVCVALGICLAVSLVRIHAATFLRFSYLSLAAGVLLTIALILFGSGPGTSGAKVNLGPIQPMEAIRFLIVLFLAGYLGRRWELVRQLRESELRGRRVPQWLNLPRLDHLVPVLGGVGIALTLFFVLRDLGPALLLSLISLSMLAMARGRIGLVVAGIIGLAGGLYAGYWLGISSTLEARVAIWQSPWENAVRGGDQVAHAAWALATGGTTGTGLGLGDTRYLPAGDTDLVLAALAEELGALGVLIAAVACAVIVWRGLHIARRASSDQVFFLSVGMVLFLAVPVLVMAAGGVGLIPLTGVVTPFLSYGGSAMAANFAALGLLAAVRSSSGVPIEPGAFDASLRWAARVLAAAAIVVLAGWWRYEVLAADRVLVEPQLSRQADGGLRYQYNPRVLDAARLLPRGAILDRRGVPLAADASVVRRAQAEYASMRVSLRDACPDPQDRCYPFGGMTFHLLGDATTRLNWAASNSSYIERDEEDRLRGFDDRAVIVRAPDADEGSSVVVRRDFRELVPLVRHRWDPRHPEVTALASRTRDLRLTIDARLQAKLSALTARFARASGVERAAIVVLDAPTGEILASVSYPWPTAVVGGGSDAPDATLDRARYGLYPPGSTFKLVTAAAALRLDPDLNRLSFSCTRLPGGRVGVKIPGRRPVHDDVLDRHPHGILTMRHGLVRSCNAYFAQMALHLGPEPLSRAAGLAGISFPTTGSAARLAENLPHAGYGQGDVLATPLRMARIAAAIGTDGLLREPSLVRNAATPPPKTFLSAESSRLLAGYLRDVVTDGTGRRLSGHPLRIAGKTGTAEIDDETSHAWFVGFAPSDAGTRRIAFAVLLENAGYGGAGAASLAGDVVTAAASLGLAR
jgi:cell division protein FtsW (lipid II flippase)